MADYYDEILLNIPFQKGISKHIFQTYRTKNLPSELQTNIQTLKSLNQDWEYHFYTDDDISNFILTVYGKEILKYYNRINACYGAAKADFFRYLVLYYYGGIYLDIKSVMTKPLDTVLMDDDEYILSQWDNKKGETHENWGKYKEIKSLEKGEYVQWFIISSAGHPFLRQVIIDILRNIDNYNPFKDEVGTMGVLRTTGPITYSLSIEKIRPKLQNHYRIASFDELGLKYSVYSGLSHKEIIKSHYNTRYLPVVNTNKIKEWITVIYFRYRFYLKAIFKR